MGILAALIKHCTKCDEFHSEDVEVCPRCGGVLEEKAVINVQELRRLVAELGTPRGLIKLLASFRRFMED